jgi:hypothetical protein
MLSGQIMGFLSVEFTHFLKEAPWMSHNWVLILSKLIRILFTPYKRDHWADIVGYAQLVVEQLDKAKESNGRKEPGI